MSKIIKLPDGEALVSIFQESGLNHDDLKFVQQFIADYHNKCLYEDSILFILRSYILKFPINDKVESSYISVELSSISHRIVQKSLNLSFETIPPKLIILPLISGFLFGFGFTVLCLRPKN